MFVFALPGPGLRGQSKTLRLSVTDYEDRVQAVWTAQIAATMLAWPYEHQAASVEWLDQFPRAWQQAPVDDDWYYEMVAIRAFEKYGVDLTVDQLGRQWQENACGSWGSSEQARLLMARGISPSAAGHPRYNKLWFSIGPQFSADIYGALAPGQPNLAGKIARELCHINGYAEAADGGVFMAAMVSLGFAETDPRVIVRKAAMLIDQHSPYRQCLDEVIRLADQNKSAREIFAAVEDRWHMEYPATNNAVANGGIVAVSLWFGQGDFLKTVNLAAGAADFTDADCNAANAASVIGAMKGMKGVPADLVAVLNDRIKGEKMGGVLLTPPVDEKISDLAKRTAAIGLQMLSAQGIAVKNGSISIPRQNPVTQPAELFTLAELTRYWNPDWQLYRAGFGGAGGGMKGIRGITYLDSNVLVTYPRDEIRGLTLSRAMTITNEKELSFDVGVDAGRAWELNVMINNSMLLSRIITGTENNAAWQHVSIDLAPFKGKAVRIRLFQRVLVPGKEAGNARWKNITLE